MIEASRQSATDRPAGAPGPTGSARGFVDLHVHVLPMFDDGPMGMEGSLALCRALVADGVCTAVASPHQLGIHEDNGRARLLPACERLNRRLMEAGVPLDVLPGGDVRIEADLLDRLDSGQAMTVADGGKYLLVELPHEVVFDLGDVIFDLARRGITAILTHPERHGRLARRVPLLRRWVRQGLRLQITAASLTGEMGEGPARAAWELLERGLVHLVASDAHAIDRRPPRMRAAYELVRDRVGPVPATRLFHDHPADVLAGRPIEGLLIEKANSWPKRLWAKA